MLQTIDKFILVQLGEWKVIYTRPIEFTLAFASGRVTVSFTE